MTQLTEAQKETVVQALACFRRPSEVVVLLKEEFGIDVPVRQVVGYDPTRASYDAGERWREFFHRTREEYVSDSLSVPIAKQGFRLRSLQEMHDKAKAAGNYVLAADILEQAAKEVGGLLSNARNLAVSNGPHLSTNLTPQERRAQAAEMIRQALLKHAEKITLDGAQIPER
jgi:hypothetical protein